MRRRLLNLAAAVSLLACCAVCLMWVRSFYVIENRTIVTSVATYECGSGAGFLAVQRVARRDGERRGMRPRVRFSALGIELIEGRLNWRRPWTLVLMPYWLPAGLFTILPTAWIAARARREANAAGRRCPACGQDRDPDGTCAACGAKPQAAEPHSAKPHSMSTPA